MIDQNMSNKPSNSYTAVWRLYFLGSRVLAGVRKVFEAT